MELARQFSNYMGFMLIFDSSNSGEVPTGHDMSNKFSSDSPRGQGPGQLK